MKKQILVWVDDAKDVGSFSKKFDLIDLPKEGKPDRVWTLFKERSKTNKPELPIKPVHLDNAFLEDYIHDWLIKDDKFKYSTRITETGVWLLFEYQ